jgi:8-amino-7-oxononanoate synthase
MAGSGAPLLPFASELEGDLAELAAAGLLRATRATPQGAVSFASNDYLGLRRDPRVVAAASRAAAEYGAGSGSSRLIAGTLALAARLEEELAAFKGTEAALVFPTGYQAAVGTLGALLGPGDEVYLDKLDHASLIDGARLSGARVRTYRHGSVDGLRRLLAKPRRGRRLVVTDGLFSMDGDLAPLRELGELAGSQGAALMVDEAHATGCLGAQGRGSAEELEAEHLVHVSMGTLSKALGGLGGFICSSRLVIDTLVNRARAFIYTTAPAPAQLGAALAALEIVRREPRRREFLRELAEGARGRLRAEGFDTGPSCTQVVPVMLGDSAAASDAAGFLGERGLHCPAVRYPTVPRGGARLRVSLTSAHGQADVQRLVGELVAWRESRG